MIGAYPLGVLPMVPSLVNEYGCPFREEACRRAGTGWEIENQAMQVRAILSQKTADLGIGFRLRRVSLLNKAKVIIPMIRRPGGP